MEQTETPIYSTNGNVISRSKAIIAGTTFAMRNVTSVRVSYDNRRRSVAWICLAIAVILVIARNYAAALPLGFLGAVLFFAKPTYTVVIITSNGKEFGALRTHDPAEARRIVDAFNSAIEQA